MSADFTPVLNEKNELGAFRFWCQKVLPLTYDDSLSYYELLCKVVKVLNDVIENQDKEGEDISNLYNAFVSLQNYTNEYFNNLDIQKEINDKLDNMASSGELSNIVSTFIPNAVTAWLSENVEPGTTPIVDSSLTISGAAADAKVVGDKFNNADYILNKYNAIPLLEPKDMENLTEDGVTWEWNNDIVHVTGTSVSTESYILYNNANALPVGFAGGNTINITQIKSGENVDDIVLQFYKYVGDSLTLMHSTAYSELFKIPNDFDGDGLLIRLRVTTGSTVNAYVKIAILNALSNEQLTNNYIIIESTNDETDRRGEINYKLSKYKYVKLGEGKFYCSGVIIPEGCTLAGCGRSTELIHNNKNTILIRARSETLITNLAIIGEYETQPTSGSVPVHSQTGILVNQPTENLIIENCFIRGMTTTGIKFDETGTSVKSALINNCDIKYCSTGLYLDKSEYACVSNCVFRDNWIGVYNYGGNNKFSCCGFDSNGWGFVVGGESNNGHGTAVACSFNHNVNRSIAMQSVIYGYIFCGCQFHDGEIVIDGNSLGTLFNSCNYGDDVVFTKIGSNVAYCIGCTFHQNPSDVEGYSNANNSLKFINCYNYNTGEQIQ